MDDLVSAQSVKARLGRYATGGGRDVRAVAELAAGERLEAAVIAMWKRRGWIAIATDAGLRVARRPWFLGRPESHALAWADLTDVRSGAQRVVLTFGGDEIDLATTGPRDEFLRLIETARRHLGGEGRPSVDELRELARRKLGRFMTFGFEAAIDGLPDRLEAGEQVERLATATHGFQGLLVLTDRRLLLLDVGLRRSAERLWAVPRADVEDAEPTDTGLLLRLAGGEPVEITEWLPAERRDEFAAVLAARDAR